MRNLAQFRRERYPESIVAYVADEKLLSLPRNTEQQLSHLHSVAIAAELCRLMHLSTNALELHQIVEGLAFDPKPYRILRG